MLHGRAVHGAQLQTLLLQLDLCTGSQPVTCRMQAQAWKAKSQTRQAAVDVVQDACCCTCPPLGLLCAA